MYLRRKRTILIKRKKCIKLGWRNATLKKTTRNTESSMEENNSQIIPASSSSIKKEVANAPGPSDCPINYTKICKRKVAFNNGKAQGNPGTFTDSQEQSNLTKKKKVKTKKKERTKNDKAVIKKSFDKYSQAFMNIEDEFLLKCLEEMDIIVDTEVDKKLQGKVKIASETCNKSKEQLQKKLKRKAKEKARKQANKLLKKCFPDTMPVSTVKKILETQNSTNLKYVEGYLRISGEFTNHAYVPIPNEESDLLIIGRSKRNRALNGDMVVARINPVKKWYRINETQTQKTGIVVCITQEVHLRKTLGYLKQEGRCVFLHPRDRKVPLVKIQLNSLPRPYRNRFALCKNVLFLAKITSWETLQFAVGEIEKVIGIMGDIKTEVKALLLEHDINTTPYDKKILRDLPCVKYLPTVADLKDREDWRQKCVFTIAPVTVTDLDDAVSCTVLENGNYEVGVHISDVTHFLKYSSPLDTEVAKRATTVYIADNVYRMLPKKLCQLCSLLPGQDKLTFSVIWEMTPDARIVKHRFAKSVINSCCQMTYEQAQSIIEKNSVHWLDNSTDTKVQSLLLQLQETVINLFDLSVRLSNRRYANGALKINQPKLHVVIDESLKLPLSYCIMEQKESNRLIEEFMLLANMTIAKHLYDTIPEYAFLRNHRIPSERYLVKIQNILQELGLPLNIESAGDLQASIKSYEPLESDSAEIIEITKYRLMVINSMFCKAMTHATYKCSSMVNKLEDLHHYALNVPFYTHFTSPIRRYADCVVHRLLYATIKGSDLPKDWNSEICARIVQNCNVRKYAAKIAEEQSHELYFIYFIKLLGPKNVIAIVTKISNRYVNAILCHSGMRLKVYLSEIIDDVNIEYSKNCSIPTLTITWSESNITQVILRRMNSRQTT